MPPRTRPGVRTDVGVVGAWALAGDYADEVASAPGSRRKPAGRQVFAAVNGLIGDRLLHERPEFTIPMAVRLHGSDVPRDHTNRHEELARLSRSSPT